MLAVNLLIAFYPTADGSGRSGWVSAFLVASQKCGVVGVCLFFEFCNGA